VAQIIAAPKGLLGAGSPQANGTIWVLAGTPEAKALTQLDLSSGQTVMTVPTSSAANSVAQSSTGLLAVGTATTTAGAVLLLNGSSGTISSTVPVGAPVRALAFGADGVTLYVLNGNGTSSSVSVVNTSTGKVLTSIGCPNDAVGLAPDPQQLNIWTVESSGNVQETSLQSGRTVSIVPLASPGIAIAFPPSGTTMYVLKGSGSIWNIAELVAGNPKIGLVLSAAAFSVGLVAAGGGNKLYDVVGTPGLGNVQVLKVPSGG